jgi:hypothetical protein
MELMPDDIMFPLFSHTTNISFIQRYRKVRGEIRSTILQQDIGTYIFLACFELKTFRTPLTLLSC